MQNETVARRYATAVFTSRSDANAIDAVGRDLGPPPMPSRGRTTSGVSTSRPSSGARRKKTCCSGVFAGKIGDIALHTILLLVRKRREALLRPIVAEYQKLALAAAGKEPLEIVSAHDLAPNELDSIVVRLSRRFGKAFDVTQRTDPSLLGGVRITMGDRRIDGSLAGRLDELSRELFARN